MLQIRHDTRCMRIDFQCDIKHEKMKWYRDIIVPAKKKHPEAPQASETSQALWPSLGGSGGNVVGAPSMVGNATAS